MINVILEKKYTKPTLKVTPKDLQGLKKINQCSFFPSFPRKKVLSEKFFDIMSEKI